ncbi:hypothetical protein A8F94_11290 [Bacillus sp. FJAT-27225]|uniref:VWA domain-containing protein n=1 Tax=Bacillus sp. FJAT-27225 TaxID=1743144 RepID=UPI00080C34BA|nr:VWA domain-containing protein [Bacillus sp. FJAT-27225]OCA85468.1 hypothetical protein A8F94_11290 [Bacillus sp. FJAT-27225]
MGFEMNYPFMLLFSLPAFFLMFLFFRQAVSLDRKVVGVLRSIVLFLLIFALAVPEVILPAKTESIVFLADRSSSVASKEGKVLDWIDKAVSSKGEGKQFAIASFANGAQSEATMSGGTTVPEAFHAELDKGETHISSGLQFASSLLPSTEGGRIVLLTDGNDTVGKAGEAARLLKNKGIELDYVVLEQDAKLDTAVSGLDVPPSLFEGEETTVTVTLTSNIATTAAIRLSVNNKAILQQNVQIKEGENAYTFTHKAEEPGLAVYKAELVNKQDAYIENNSLHAVSTVRGTPRVLVVEGKPGGPLPAILESSDLLVEKTVPEKLPTALGGYLHYQSIIFENVPGHRVTQNQMDLIEKAVREFGTGFVMTGGEGSFGLGGYFKTPIEKVLPVDMDIKGKKEMPSLGLVIVIDRSGSMSGNKLSLAKEAAARSVELLREEDTLGFIAFDDQPWTIVETAPLKDKKKAVNKIRSIPVGGGTNIYPALAKAYEELRDLKLQRKHIILLTDGQSAAGGDYAALIGEGKDKNITLSTVALGADADRLLLEDLAEMGSGRFYDVSDASVIPSVLSRETVMTTRTYIEDNPFYPLIESYPEWAVRFSAGVPQMNAYIATTPKTRATVPILSEKEDPVLAEWQYGLGKALAFTSDVSGKWSGDWARWDGWPGFLNQLVSASLPQYNSEPFSVSVGKEGGDTIAALKSASKEPLPVEASLLAENGQKVDANMKLVRPGEYELVFPSKPGMYYLSLQQTGKNGEAQLYRTGFSVPYSDEFLLEGTNRGLLKELALISGGKELTVPKDAFRALANSPKERQPISEYLLLAAFLLLVLEIFIRRFGVRVFSKLIPKRVKLEDSDVAGGAVIGRLTGAKEKASRKRPAKAIVPAPGKPEKPLKEVQPHGEQQTQVKPKSQAKPANTKQELSPEQKQERMNRLLEAKKRSK